MNKVKMQDQYAKDIRLLTPRHFQHSKLQNAKNEVEVENMNFRRSKWKNGSRCACCMKSFFISRTVKCSDCGIFACKRICSRLDQQFYQGWCCLFCYYQREWLLKHRYNSYDIHQRLCSESSTLSNFISSENYTDNEELHEDYNSEHIEIRYEDESWKENWLFQTRNHREVFREPVAMFVPNSEMECRAMIGDRDVDDLSDLTECSDYSDDEIYSNLILETESFLPTDFTFNEQFFKRREQYSIFEVAEEVEEQGQPLSNISQDRFSSSFSDKKCIKIDSATTDEKEIFSENPLSFIYSSDSFSEKPRIWEYKTGKLTDETERYSSLNNNTHEFEEINLFTPPKPGSIAEREHKKWENAAPIKNNPYSRENIEKRLQEKEKFSGLLSEPRFWKNYCKSDSNESVINLCQQDSIGNQVVEVYDENSMTVAIGTISDRENKEESSGINEGNSLQSCHTISLEENNRSMNKVPKEQHTCEGSFNCETSNEKIDQKISGAVVSADKVNKCFYINGALKNWMMDAESNSTSNDIAISSEEISMPSVKKLIQTFNEIHETSFSIKGPKKLHRFEFQQNNRSPRKLHSLTGRYISREFREGLRQRSDKNLHSFKHRKILVDIVEKSDKRTCDFNEVDGCQLGLLKSNIEFWERIQNQK